MKSPGVRADDRRSGGQSRQWGGRAIWLILLPLALAAAPVASAPPSEASDSGSASGDDARPAPDHAFDGGTGPHGAAGPDSGDTDATMDVHHEATPQAASDMSGMSMGPMQGGRAPADARSGDYSDGISHSAMVGMDMADSAPLGMLLIDQLEAFDGSDANGRSWEAQGWYGGDRDKVWLRTEGERTEGTRGDGDLELFWNRAVSTWWSTQLGVRSDFGEGPPRHWAAVGVQGLAPYWFETEATVYIGEGGRSAARVRAEYELLLTQRWILQPELELNAYGQSDPARRIGGGLADAQFAMRLRYEFSRQFAPYVGVNAVRSLGATAGSLRADGKAAFDRQIVAGIRLWF